MLSIILILSCSLFFPGVILRTKSITAGRKGPGLFQPVKDVVRLFRKGTIYSETTSIIFRDRPGYLLCLNNNGLFGNTCW